jgi:predicted phage terminase large subunit-like protein
MPTTYRYQVHAKGPALWPDHKSLEEVLELRNTTPLSVWEATYQGNPTPPGGTIFLSDWWDDPKRRFLPTDPVLHPLTVARWISWDTAMKDKLDSDYTALVVGELLSDYRLIIREVRQDRVTFPDLTEWMTNAAKRYAADEKLRGIIIEDKGSGTSVYQTLASSSETWLGALLIPFLPLANKIQRAEQAAVWCKLGCVMLPMPHADAPWLFDFTDQLYRFPGDIHDDMVDSFSQLVIYLEHLLAEGWRLREGVS